VVFGDGVLCISSATAGAAAKTLSSAEILLLVSKMGAEVGADGAPAAAVSSDVVVVVVKAVPLPLAPPPIS